MKIENIKPAASYKQDDDLTLKKFSKITTLDKIHFEISNCLSQTVDAIMPLSSLPKLAKEQFIAVKAQVFQISGVKRINSDIKGTLHKQEVVIRDPTSSAKLTLWENYVGCLNINQTFDFKNVRVKGYGMDRYLNTPMKETFLYTPCAAFEQALATVDSYLMESAISRMIEGWIIGVQKSTRSLACNACQKNVVVNPDNILAVCSSCNLKQTQSSCHIQWMLRVVVKPSDEATKPSSLGMSHSILKDVMESLSAEIDLTTPSEDDIVVTLLSTKKVFKCTLDTRYQITDIQP